MSWIVRILEAEDSKGRTVFDVVTTYSEASPDTNPDTVVATYPDRLKARVAARLLTKWFDVGLHEAEVIPFPRERGRA